MGDLQDRIRHDENALQKLMGAIPGFQGYHEAELRRTADKLLREHLVSLLASVRDRLNALQRQLSQGTDLKPVTDLSRITRRLLRSRDRIEHAGYGYAGFLEAVKIDNAALDRLYDFDLSLREMIGQLDGQVSALGDVATDHLIDNIRAIGDTVDELGRLIDMRNDVAADLTP